MPVSFVTVSLPSLVREHFGKLVPDAMFASSFPILTDLVIGIVAALICLCSAACAANLVVPKAVSPLSNMQVLGVWKVVRACIAFKASPSPFFLGVVV